MSPAMGVGNGMMEWGLGWVMGALTGLVAGMFLGMYAARRGEEDDDD